MICLIEQVHIDTGEELEFFVLDFVGFELKGLFDRLVGLLDEGLVAALGLEEE